MKGFHFNLIIIIMSISLSFSTCQEETEFHCSPKPGCQISQCDPVVPRWDRLGFQMERDVDRNEFPITCKSKKITKSSNEFMLSFMQGNAEDIRNVRSEVKELEGKVEKISEKFQDTTPSTSTQEIAELQQSFKQFKAEMQLEIQELRKELKELRQKDRGGTVGTEDKTEQPEDEETMDKKKTDQYDCAVYYKSKCFQVYHRPETTFNDARRSCRDLGMNIGNVYDATHYRILVIALRSKIPYNLSKMWFWTGMTIKDNQVYLSSGDPISLPEEVWIRGYPSSVASRTNVVFEINKDKENKRQGIYNIPPSLKLSGIICEM